MNTRGKVRKHAKVTSKARTARGMGVLSKALAVLLAVNMAVMFALPIGIFADEVIVTGDIGATYGGSAPAAESPEVIILPDENSVQAPVEDVIITPQGGFQPLAITPMEADENAGTWSELIDAINNVSDGGTVHLTQNIQRVGGADTNNDLPAINKNITIDGGGFELDFRDGGTAVAVNSAGFKLASRTVPTNFTLRNIKILRTNATTYPLISANGSQVYNYRDAATANWTISIADLTTTGSPTSSFISASDSVVVFSGTVKWEMPATSTYWNMNVKGVTFEEDSNVSLESGDNVIVIYPATQNTSTYTYVELKRGAQATIHSASSGASGATDTTSHQSAIRMNYGYNANTTSEQSEARALLKLFGEGTLLKCSSDGSGYGRWGGVIVVAGGAGGGEAANGGHIAIDISGGAKLEAESNGAMPAMVQQVPQATLKITDPGSELNLDMHGTSGGDYRDLRAALRFRYVGGQTFDVQNYAEVHIVRHNAAGTGDPAAVRFGTGPRNSFYVRSSGVVHIENNGNGTPSDASSYDGDNAAVEFDANYFTFDVSGYQSAIELIAAQGPAVDAGSSQYGTITVGQGAIFLATGQTASAPTTAASAIFKAGNGLKFSATDPLYYDFSNTRPGGGNIFNVSSSGTGTGQSTFRSINSDVAVWSNGRYASYGWPYTPVTGDPFAQWSRISYTLYGEDFGTFSTSDDDTFRPRLGAEGLRPYTRISGNNANPVIMNNDLTNADQIVRFMGTVAEGLPSNPARAIWTDEVFGRFQHNGSGDFHVTSVLTDTYEQEVLVEPLRGVLRYDPGTGNFLIPGDTYRLTSVWRGPEDVPVSDRNHMAQGLPIIFTVKDVTPPTPVELTSHTDGGTIWMDRGTIKGTYVDMSSVAYNSEPITRIYAELNGVEVQGSNAQFDTDGTGTWTINLNTTTIGWHDDDILSIIAVDSTGNKNPLTATAYHDTTFPAAPSLTVREFPVQLSAVNASTTLTPARAIQVSSNPLDRLEELIGATATIKPGREGDWSGGLGVTVIDDGGFVAEGTKFDLTDWRTKYGMDPQLYTITYQLDGDISYTATATVTVWPFTGGDPPYIFANDFTYSLNNTIALLNMMSSEREAKLIEQAEATAVASVDHSTGAPVGALSPDNVVLRGHTIPVIPEDGEIYTVTFEMRTEPVHRVTVNIHVVGGPFPLLNVTSPIHIWSGDPAERAVYAPNALLPSEFNMWDGVQAWATSGGMDITDDVTIEYNRGQIYPNGLSYDAAGNLVSPQDDTYRIVYQVINSDSNPVTAVRTIVVSKGVVGGDYSVDAYDFVVTKTEVENAATEAQKKTLATEQSYAFAQRLTLGADDPVGTLIPISVPVDIRNLGGLSAQMNNNLTRDYTITIGAVREVPPFGGDPLWGVNAKVIDKQEIARDGDATAKTHYVVAANNVSRTTLEATNGIASLGAAEFIDSTAHPVAYEITGASRPDSGFIKTNPIGYEILENNIPSPVVPGEWTVKLRPEGQDDVICVITYTISGTAPIITPEANADPYESGSPLVVRQTLGQSHVLTDAEMKAKMTVIDGQDGPIEGLPGSYPLLGADVGTTWIIAGGVTGIDTRNVGVYSVTYTATDSDGMQSSLTRAIVVTDDRYVIDKGVMSDPSDGIIIGAQNFVKLSRAVNPNTNVVRNDARASAYNENGTPVGSTNLYIDPWPVDGYVLNAQPRPYDFTFKVQNRVGSKTIHGFVVDADVIYHGSQDEQYSLVLSHFQKNIEEAQAMFDSGDLHAAEILAANATTYSLVDDAPAARAYVITDNGFPDNPARVGAWDIRFAIERSDNGNYPGLQIPTATERITGTVSQGELPFLDVTTPIEVQQGSSFSLYGGISLRDVEDGDPLNNGALDPAANLTVEYTLLPAGQTSVNPSVPGIYGISYHFEDSDNNPVDAQRVVVVNDGHYTVSTTDRGRVLYANSFLTKSIDVSDQASQRNGQIKDKAHVALYDGVTGDEVDSGVITVSENDGYSPSVGEYGITLRADNSPSGFMTRYLTAKVVDVSVLEPSAPNVFGPTTYVYGRNLFGVGIGTAEQYAAGGLPGVIDALSADATLVSATGVLSDSDAEVTEDSNNFISRLLGSDLYQKQDTFFFEVADTSGAETITLTLNTSVGEAPVLLVPRPQNFDMPLVSTSLDGNGNLTHDAIMTGVVATDEGAVTPADPMGYLTSEVTYRIYDVNGTELFSIPGNVAAIYRVEYTVEDNDYNRVSESRALIVNDGRFEYDDEFVLSARSFIINSSLTTPSQASDQIRQYSEARAWRSDGTNAAATVTATADYPNNNTEFLCTIRVLGYGALEKDITARIVSDVTGVALPGASDTDYNSDNGDGYAISARNFRINTTDAATLVAKAGTTEYAATLEQRAVATAYDRTTEYLLSGGSGSAVLVDDGGFALAANQPLEEGDVFNITFKAVRDDEATTTIKVFVSDANPPDLIVPAYKYFSRGAVITPAQYMEGVSASDPEDGDIITPGAISYDASAVDTSKRGIYPVIYRVTDKDYNETTKQGQIIIDYKVLGDYAIDAYCFVKLEGSISGSNADILASSFARAWRIKTSNPDEWPSLPIEVAPSIGPLVKANDDGYTSNATEGDYTIQLGVNPEVGYTDEDKTEPIIARVIDRDIISNVAVVDDGGTPANPADDTPLSPGVDQNTANPTDTDRYVIAANNAMIRYSEVAGYVGNSSTAIANLIAKARPVAYRMAGNTETTPATITEGNVRLLSNEITANASKGNSFWVTFSYENLPSIYVTVKFTVIPGEFPVIDFDQTPLTINQTHADTPQILPNTVLDDYVRVWDSEDVLAGYPTQLAIQVVDQNNQPVAEGIDSNKIGVYRVRYVATDGDGNNATRYRAVVVTDGRYVIPDEDGDFILDEGAAIIGARDFIVKQSEVNADLGTIKSASYAEAFNAEGTSLEASLTLVIPPGYTTGTAAEGEYDFTWGVAGYDTQKLITGTVVVADWIDSGGKNSQYSIVASHFLRNVEDARVIVITGDSAFIEAASAKVYTLVDGVADRDVVVYDRGGFVPLDPQVNAAGVYDIVFGIDGIATTSQRAPVKGTVSNRTPPELTVPTPLPVWMGDPSGKGVNDILPADYHIKYGVTASDVEDVDLDVDDVIAEYVGTPLPSVVDYTTEVGPYLARYYVKDSDNNEVTKYRVVLINDARWVPGEGRLLRANPFVISVDDVQSTQPYINQQLLSLTNAELRDATTNVSITGDQLFIADTDGYGKAVGTYNITVAGIDNPASNPNITKTVTAEVVGAEVVVVGPNNPNRPNYAVFGNNIVLTPAEAQAIVDDADATAALLRALSAGARVSHPDGTLERLDVALTDTDDFLSKTFVSGAAVSNTGIYHLSLANSGNSAVAIPGGSHPEPLTVTVASGGLPVITALPAPLRIPLSDTPGTLTEAQLMEGVSATDPEDVSLTPTILGGIPTIASDEFSVTKLTYTVTDSAGNTVSKSRAVIVDDGSIHIGINYMLRANSFVINIAEVDTYNRDAQLLDLSEAEGWTITGDALDATDISVVGNAGGYTNSVGDYRVGIQVNNESSLVRTITAKVVNDPIIKNGDRYTISGNHFRVNVRDANVLVTKAADEIAAEFTGRADVKSYKRSETMVNQAGTKAMTSDGGFGAHGAFALSDEGSTFSVTFKVAEDDTAEITVICTVSNAAPPELTVPGLKSSPLGEPISDAKYREGVVANDAVDGNRITADVIYDASAVDVNAIGPYPVSYQVTDSDDNTTYATGYILIGWDAIGDYGVHASDFERGLSDVTGTDAEILEASHAEAVYFDVATATLKPAVAFVKDAAGYQAREGVFAGIKIGATSDIPGLQGDPTAVVNATVFNDHISYTVTFNPNGGMLTGPDTITVVDRTTLFYMPSSPVRTGYTFRYWGTVTGVQFTATTQLTGDITLYAYWQVIPATAPPTPPPTVIINNPPAVAGNTFITVEPATENSEVVVSEPTTPMDSGQTPIPEGGIPTSPNEPLEGWSLLNLLAAILSLLLLVFFLIKLFMDRARTEKYEEEPVDAQLWAAMSPEQRAQHQARRDSDYQSWLANQQRSAGRQRALFVNVPVLLIAAAAFIESLVVLFMTQDFSFGMGIVDGYTALFVLILLVQLLAPMVAAIIQNNRREDQPLQAPSGGNDVTL